MDRMKDGDKLKRKRFLTGQRHHELVTKALAAT